MAPTWSQDGAKSLQVGAKMAILRPFGKLFKHFWWSWERSLEKLPKCKNEQRYNTFAVFFRGGLGPPLEDPGGCLGSVLGAMLEDVGSKMVLF